MFLQTALPFQQSALYARLHSDSQTEWNAYINHEFVRKLAGGTLPKQAFLAWMIQDYLYLIQYARAYALLVYKSDSVAHMQSTSAILHGLLTEEMALHRAQLQAAGISASDLETAQESIETLAYGRYILDRAHTGDVLDLVVTLSPCLAGYGEIGLRLIGDTNIELHNHPYRDWIETYGGETYLGFVREGLTQLEDLAATYGATARYPMLLKQFRQSVRLETEFWNAGRLPAQT